jgi:site-specific recombinase XerD
MLDKSFGLLFYLKKPKNYMKGEIPIYLRLTVDGISKELSVKRSCDPFRWNPHAGRAMGTKENIKALNCYLDTYQSKVFEAKRKLMEGNHIVTASAIKDILIGVDQRNKMLIKIFEDYNADVKKLIEIDYSKSTWTKYDRAKRFSQDFIRWKYKTDDIHIRQLNFDFVNQYEIWLKTIRKCCHNTSLKYISILKMIILYCKDNQWLDHDPFARFEMKKEDVEPIFLTKEEIQLIAEKEILNERLSRVRDIYIFCCFTGLAYADVEKLKKTEISVGFDDQLWIFTDRLKTKIKSRIPLLPVSNRIIKKYENDPFCINSNKVLPVLSNQKYNAYLKEIADIAGISKTLTTHTARHTFGTTVTLGNGVPIESVSKMLGHKKISTTQHYARVLDIKVGEDMQKLKDRLTTIATEGQVKSDKL